MKTKIEMKIETEIEMFLKTLLKIEMKTQMKTTLREYGVCTDVVIDPSYTLPVVFPLTCSKNKQKLRNKKKK